MVDERVEGREKWSYKAEFILSCLGFAVGLGNVWRFPYQCGKYGGAAFMIPYLVMIVLVGLPTFYMELALGQYASLTPHILFKRMCPLFTGLGHAMICISAFAAIYYNMVMAIAFYYFQASFNEPLPWSDCRNEWNNYNCRDPNCFNADSICIGDSKTYNHSFLDHVSVPSITNTSDPTMFQFIEDNRNAKQNVTVLDIIKDKYNKTVAESPAHQYYNLKVLNRSDEFKKIGQPKMDLVLCLFLAWVLVFLCLIKGIRSSGKVVYFTATFPYVILVTLLFSGAMMEGAGDGISFYVEPNLHNLTNMEVWSAAAGQILFSLSLGSGGLITLASYNEFHNNVFRDTLLVVVGNCGTSIFAGFVIFSFIGAIAKKTGQSVASLSKEGTGLVFIVFADAVNMMPFPSLWAVLFFFMLIILAVDTMIVIVEVVITAIIDQWPSLRSWKKRILVVAAICASFFACGVILCTPEGSYILLLLDTYIGNCTLIILALCEVCMVSWIYGIRRFLDDVRCMLGLAKNHCYGVLGYPVSPYWILAWVAATPILLATALGLHFAHHENLMANNLPLPDEAHLVGWLLVVFCVGWIPIVALYKVIKSARNRESLRLLIQPTEDWGPSGTIERRISRSKRSTSWRVGGPCSLASTLETDQHVYYNNAFRHDDRERY